MKKKIIKWIMMFGVSCMIQVANAQSTQKSRPQFTPEQKAEKITTHLKQQLSLNDEQAGKVKTVFLEHLQKIQNRSEKRKDAHVELESNLSKILTPEQLDKFKANQDERKQQMRNRKNQHTQPSENGGENNQNPDSPE